MICLLLIALINGLAAITLTAADATWSTWTVAGVSLDQIETIGSYVLDLATKIAWLTLALHFRAWARRRIPPPP